MSKFLKFIVDIFMIAAILSAAAILVPPLCGVNQTIVDSTSMNTNLPLGSVTYSNVIDVSQIQVGDEILKETESSTYAYIIKSGDETTGEYYVVSAANESGAEEKIYLRNTVPKVAVVVPYLGYIMMAMHSIEGIMIIALVVILVIILFVLSELWKPQDDDEDEEDEEDDEEEEEYEDNENGIDTATVRKTMEANVAAVNREDDGDNGERKLSRAEKKARKKARKEAEKAAKAEAKRAGKAGNEEAYPEPEAVTDNGNAGIEDEKKTDLMNAMPASLADTREFAKGGIRIDSLDEDKAEADKTGAEDEDPVPISEAEGPEETAETAVKTAEMAAEPLLEDVLDEVGQPEIEDLPEVEENQNIRKIPDLSDIPEITEIPEVLETKDIVPVSDDAADEGVQELQCAAVPAETESIIEEEPEDPNRFEMARRQTLGEMMDQARADGVSPEILQDSASGVTVLDYTGLI